MATKKRGTRYYRVSGGIIPAPDLPCLYEDLTRRVQDGDNLIPWPFVYCQDLPAKGTAVSVKKASKKR